MLSLRVKVLKPLETFWNATLTVRARGAQHGCDIIGPCAFWKHLTNILTVSACIKNHYFVIPDWNLYILMYVLYSIMVLIAFFISLDCDCDKPNIWCWIPSGIAVQSGSQHIAPSCQAVLAHSSWPFRLCEWWGRRADGNLVRPG